MPQLSPEQELLEEPYAYEFFQAVRLLERIHPDEKRVGGDAMPHEEIVRFRSRVALDFPASEIHEMRKVIDETGQSERLEMLVNFMGVIGVSGALPTHYTELVLDRIRHRDTTMWAFFDIFTHRIVSLFYRAWAKYRFPINYEAGDESFTAYLYDLAGLGTRGLRGRMAVEDEALLPYTGLIAQAPYTADGLANMISDHFGAKAKIEQFSGQWLLLDGRDVTQLGAKNSSLGRSAIVGTRVWDQQSKFRVRLGPLDLKRFQAFLPSGSAHEPLKSIVKFMVGDELDLDVQLVLEAKQVPATILTTRAIRRPSLGWTSFLKTKPFKEPDDQVVLKMAA